MRLISFMPKENSPSEIEKFKDRLASLNIQGIETIVGDYCPMEAFHRLPIKGMHLIYFPTWLEFWQGKAGNCYGFSRREELIRCFRDQFETAKKLKVEYMVFHVSHVRSEDIFTMEFGYSDEDVFSAALEIINEVFTGDGPMLLFENLPWPGLNFKDCSATKKFLDSVSYSRKGFVLDLSHLMCLNSAISDFDEGAEYILSEISKIQELREYIYGVHINGSISREYLAQDFSHLLEKWQGADTLERYYIEADHVKSIDTHSVFASKKLKEILDSLPLKYRVFELKHSSLEELLDQVKKQNEYIFFK